MDTDLLTQPRACLRVPAEILLEIFEILTPSQSSLHACVLTCRQWNRVATPVLWKCPRFSRLTDVESFAATLLTVPGYPQQHSVHNSNDSPKKMGWQTVCSRPYARLIETLSFSTLPEPDRNNPHLATLLDTIINSMAVISPPKITSPSNLPSGWDATDRDSAPTLLKRSRSLPRNEDATTRPHSTVGLPLPDHACDTATSADTALIDDAASETALDEGKISSLSPQQQHHKQLVAPKVTNNVVQEHLGSAVEDLRLFYPQNTQIQGVSSDMAFGLATSQSRPSETSVIDADCTRTLSAPCATINPVYTSSLRQLDLRFCKGVRNYSLQRLAPKLAPLTVLNLAGGLRTDITIAKLSQHVYQLRRISLAWTSNLTDFGVSELVQRCKMIECLDLTYCTQLEDTSMFSIAHNLHNLTALSVAYCAGITDIGVREVATCCPRLRVLNVAKCLRVTDRVRKSLEQQHVVSECDSFEPFSIYRFASKSRYATPMCV
ncbi:hypothetical protein H4S08_001803 [Coemansia sp. RSA 1365]|nr:hypothetical protein H4S08_001803 [Coemansia sp. RSA 1365]